MGGSSSYTDEALIEVIASLPASRAMPWPAVSSQSRGDTEARLGCPLPDLLWRLYARIGNGGFGPQGGRVIGASGGVPCDLGDLAQTYWQYAGDSESPGRDWPSGLVPFCAWGGMSFSCVDCAHAPHAVHFADHGEVFTSVMTLRRFLEKWVADEPMLVRDPASARGFVNPFTQQPATAYRVSHGGDHPMRRGDR